MQKCLRSIADVSTQITRGNNKIDKKLSKLSKEVYLLKLSNIETQKQKHIQIYGNL